MPYAVQFGTVLDSIGRPRVNFVYTLGSLLLTIVSNLVFIRFFGAYGAATGTLLAYALTFVAMQVYLRKHLKTDVLKPFCYMFKFYRRVFTQGLGGFSDGPVAVEENPVTQNPYP
jgi:Na+-driven multidrug efflux pump